METEFIGRRLKLQHLKVVTAVAEWGSMVKAAKHLAVSQPVVSKVIADLEVMLSVRLFDRSSQGVEPTLYGRALLKRSLALFDDLKASVDEIKFLADPTAGELRVGSTEPLLAGLGVAVMERLWRQYPRINLRVVEADSATLLNRDLPERRIELAIVPLLTDSVSEDLAATILFQDHMRLVVGVNNRWARRRNVKLAELIDEPWCVAPSSVGSLIAEAFRSSGLAMPRIALTTTTAHLLFQLLESGRFIGHFGDRLLQFYANRFALKKLPIELPIPPFAVAIVMLKNRTISPVAQLFIDCAREVARPFAKRQSRSTRSPTGRKGKTSGRERG
jgi:DNA-binding transcriptional LysR family regulator